MLGTKTRSALLIDYDNVTPFFRNEKFAARVGNWLSWLEDGVFDPRRRRRNFVFKKVFWHKRYDGEQPAFEQFEFETQTCVYAAGTKRGLSAVDIHLAIDAVHSVTRIRGLREVIILATDSDYLPVIEHLNARGIQTGIVVSQRDASAVYEGKASYAIKEEELRTALSYVRGRRKSAPKAEQHPAPPTEISGRPPVKRRKPKFDLEMAADAVVAVAATSPEHRVGLKEIAAAIRAIEAFRNDQTWLTLGSFEKFVDEMVRRRPDLIRVCHPPTGRIKIDYVGKPGLKANAPIDQAGETPLDSAKA